MYGFLHKLKSRVSSPCRDSPQHEQATKVRIKSTVPSVTSVSPPSSSLLSSPSTSSTKPPQPQSALSSRVRWSRQYDLFVCHSSVNIDIEEATRLVSFLEASPCGLRCFLWERDTNPGAAIPTELCQAFQDSHCWALLITPGFLQDQWCKYMMHQALAAGPMSNRIIPLIQGLCHPQYPLELQSIYYIDLSTNPDRGYTKVNETVLMRLKVMVKNDTHDWDMGSPGNRFVGDDSSQENKVFSNGATSEPSLSFTQ